MRYVLALALVALVGCNDGCDGAKSKGFGNYMQTVEHDGHKFILASTSTSTGGVSMIHHPDCPCGKK